MVKVSVIVPVYNTRKYLRKCLDSLINQSLEEIEIVIIDDGSTDESPEIIAEYLQLYPQKIKSLRKENGGQAAARNVGIKICEGEYIGFLDSDDYAEYNMFKDMYDTAKSTSCDLVECNYRYVDEEQREIKQYGHIRKYKSQREMLINPLVSPWNKLFKRSMLLESGVLFPEGVIYEDTAFFIQLIPYIKNMELVDKPMVYHVLRSSSTMNAIRSRKIANIFVVLKIIIDYYKSIQLYDEYKKELEYFCVKILLCSSLGRVSQVKDKQIKKELMDETLSFIRVHFPNYRDNDYFKNGKQNLYMKSITKTTLPVYVWIMGIFRK